MPSGGLEKVWKSTVLGGGSLEDNLKMAALVGTGMLVGPEVMALGSTAAPTLGAAAAGDATAASMLPTLTGYASAGPVQELAMLQEGLHAGGASGLPSWATLSNAKDALGAASTGKGLLGQEQDQPIVPGQLPQRNPPQQGAFPTVMQVLDQSALQELRRKRRGLL